MAILLDTSTKVICHGITCTFQIESAGATKKITDEVKTSA